MTNLCIASLNFSLFFFVLYCYAFVQYCYLKSIQYNAMHKFVSRSIGQSSQSVSRNFAPNCSYFTALRCDTIRLDMDKRSETRTDARVLAKRRYQKDTFWDG